MKLVEKCLIVGLLVVWLAVPLAAQDARTVINNAARAMGSETLKSVEYTGSGFDFALGQSPNPTSPWPRFINKTYTRAIDYDAKTSRMTRIRMQGENPPSGGGQQPVIGEQNQNQTVTPTSTWVQQLEIWMTPYGFLKAAATRDATIQPQTVSGRRLNVVTFTGENKARVNGYINDQNMVEKVETWIDNAMLGDMLFEAIYADYQDFGGLKFPTSITQRQGGYPILQLTITDVKPNVPVTIPPAQGAAGGGGAAAAAPAAGAPAAAAATPATPSEKLADGVYLILGGYASIAVEMRDHIVVIEGPQSEARANAIIAEAKRLIPNKPIRYVVNTHHHFDHSSGLRAFVAEGATIVTHEINKPFYERAFAAPRLLNPDRLAQANRAPTFETMTDRKVMTDGNQIIELHRLQGSGHNDGLIVAYLPKQKILLEADGYNPPGQPPAAAPAQISPYVSNLADNIQRLNLAVDRIIPVHYPGDNRAVPMAELLRMAGKGN